MSPEIYAGKTQIATAWRVPLARLSTCIIIMEYSIQTHRPEVPRASIPTQSVLGDHIVTSNRGDGSTLFENGALPWGWREECGYSMTLHEMTPSKRMTLRFLGAPRDFTQRRSTVGSAPTGHERPHVIDFRLRGSDLSNGNLGVISV